MTAHLVNAEMESAVLGLCMVTPTITSTVLATYELSAADFAGHGHAELWQAILRISDREHHADPLTLTAELGAEHKTTVDRALILTAQPHSLPGHVAELKQLALRRAWQSAGHLLLAAADTNDERAVAQAEQQIAAPTVSHDTSDPDQLGSDAYEWMAATGQTAISTGFPTLDRSIGGGLRPGDMTAIAGWTNHGKSPLADGMLYDAAMSGRRCHLYLNEMSRLDRTLRLVAMMTGLSMSRMQTRELTVADAATFTQAVAQLPFGMSDVASWSPEQIARHIRSSRWDLACVDILHNIAYEGEAELSRIVQMLAAAARSSATHLLVVCHLNEKRADGVTLPRPVIRDIRGSGMVKNLCANVLLLHRPQHREANDEISTSLDGFVHADKTRHGQPASAPVVFVAKRMRFVLDDGREAA